VVDGHARPDDRKRQQVAGRPVVVVDGHQERQDRKRVHADALVPAKFTRDEVRDLGEEEAAPRRDRGDHEREPELVALHRAAHASKRPADAEERQHRDEQERGGDHLPGHAERRQEDDHVVGHARNLRP
jgi:hypothetical protein